MRRSGSHRRGVWNRTATSSFENAIYQLAGITPMRDGRHVPQHRPLQRQRDMQLAAQARRQRNQQLDRECHIRGSLNECDDNGISAAALLSGSTDADWFRATFTEATITCVVDPSISLDSKGQTTRLCVYTRCSSSQNSGQSMACQDGSSADNSTVAGYYGCCKSGINPSFRFDSDCEQCNGPFGACSGDDDSASVYFRVDNLSAAQVCSDYSLNMHF